MAVSIELFLSHHLLAQQQLLLYSFHLSKLECLQPIILDKEARNIYDLLEDLSKAKTH
jgi:hypothetical protein